MLSRAHNGGGASFVGLQSNMNLLQWVTGLQQQQWCSLFLLKIEITIICSVS